MANNFTFTSSKVDLNAANQNTHVQPLNGLNYCVNSGLQYPLVYSSFPLVPSRRVNFGNNVEVLELTTCNATPGCMTNGLNVIPKKHLNVKSLCKIPETVKNDKSEKISENFLERTTSNFTLQNKRNIKNVKGTENVQVVSLRKNTEDFEVDTFANILGKTVEEATLSVCRGVLKNDINVTPKENLQGESSTKTSDILKISISDNTPAEMLTLKSPTSTYKNTTGIIKCVMPEENLQLKRSLKTYEKMISIKNLLSKSLNREPGMKQNLQNVMCQDIAKDKNVSGTKNLLLESAKNTIEDFKVHNSDKIAGKILDQMAPKVLSEDIKNDLNVTPAGNLQVKSSTRASGNSLEKIIKLKSPTLTFKDINDTIKDVIPEENLQLKKSIKTYKRVNIKENLKSKSLNETSNVGMVLNSNKKLNHKPANNIHENLCVTNKCGMCNKSFASHQMIKTSNYYICFNCNETFRLKIDLLQNTMIHKEKENMCNFCHNFFKDSVHLIRHVKSTHHVKNNEKLFLCDVCDKEFMYMHEIASHRKLHFMSSSGTEKDLIVKKIRNHHVCTVCLKNFTNKFSLDLHYRIHTGTKPYACKLCNAKFFCARDFERHRRIMHPNRNADYYSCNLCPKRFKLRKSFEDHLNYHNGFTPYECEHCDEKFSEKYRLKNHRIAMHSEKQSNSCKFCSKEFSCPQNLRRHISRHLNIKPFKCEVCPKAFFNHHALHKHRRTHTGEKPYVCDVCQKGFSLRYNYQVHYRIHTGEKPFVCEICNKAFRVKMILKEHYNTHKSKKM